MIPNMPTTVEYITTPAQAREAVAKILQYDVVGFDTETYNAVDRHVPAFEPVRGARVRLAQFACPTGDVFVFDLFRCGDQFMYQLFPNPFLCVGQNLKFDLKFLQFQFGIYKFGPTFDTMLAEQVISQGRVSKSDPHRVFVGLDRLAYKHLNVRLPKDEQKSDWWMPDLSNNQIAYAARDALIVLPIWQKQREMLVAQGQDLVAELEFKATPMLSLMENHGIILDKDRWIENCKNTEKEIERSEKALWKMLAPEVNTLFEGIPPINLRSRDQIKEAFKKIGIDVPLDKEGKPSVSKDNIKDINRPEIQAYLEFVTLTKGLTSYGYKWIDMINPYSGRLHGAFNQIGAETGRLSGMEPNMMQLPKKDSYRNCFVAADGFVFLDSDLGQAELRILAELCRDPNMLKAFDEDLDLHTYTASMIFSVPMEKVTKDQRGLAKNINFGIVYGIGAEKFAVQSGIPVAQAREIMDFYLSKAYPRMGSYLNNQAAIGAKTFKAQTILGRVRKYIGDFKDREFVAKVQRNSKNMPIQGTNADILKRAMALLYNEIVDKGYIDSVKPLLPIHDEILSEVRVDMVETASEMQNRCMLVAEQEFLVRVPPAVDSVITLEWCKEATEKQLTRVANYLLLTT